MRGLGVQSRAVSRFVTLMRLVCVCYVGRLCMARGAEYEGCVCLFGRRGCVAWWLAIQSEEYDKRGFQVRLYSKATRRAASGAIVCMPCAW